MSKTAEAGRKQWSVTLFAVNGSKPQVDTSSVTREQGVAYVMTFMAYEGELGGMLLYALRVVNRDVASTSRS